MENVREIVLDTLLALEKEQEFSHKLIKAVLDKYDYLDSREKSFAKRLTEGTIERRIELDYYLNQYSSVKVAKMKPLIRNLLRMSVYQLVYMDSVPDSAVCNEACKLAGKRKFQNLKGFVNGVLRSVAKNRNQLALPDREKEFKFYLSVKYSMPEWIVEMWLNQYGRTATEKILEGLLQIHKVSLRFVGNRTKEERERLVDAILKRGAVLTENPYLQEVYQAEKVENIEELPGFEEGEFTVQDVSSVLAVKAIGIKNTDFVLDMCAAPGGKSILAAQEAREVLAGDVSEKKTSIIEENAARLKAANVRVRVHDASVYDESLLEKADVCILDVPCSGLGVMGKKRDIKYRVNKENLENLEKLQKQIVEACYRYVKPGGILLYSTCTIRKEENQDMVQWILQNLPFEATDLEKHLPDKLVEQKRAMKEELVKWKLTEETEKCCIQLLPGYMEADGFFFARLRRKEQA